MMRKLSRRKKARNTNIKRRGGSGALMRSRTKTVRRGFAAAEGLIRQITPKNAKTSVADHFCVQPAFRHEMDHA